MIKRRCSFHLSLVVALLSTPFVMSCQSVKSSQDLSHTTEDEPKKSRKEGLIKTMDHAKWIEIPPGMVKLASVQRPRVLLRAGPGGQFPVMGDWLKLGEHVAVFHRKEMWVKVVQARTNAHGWVHQKSLGKVFLNQTKLMLEKEKLPTVFSVKDINTAYSFPEKKKKKVSIPKGKNFLALMVNPKRTLVWVESNNTLIWLRTYEAR